MKVSLLCERNRSGDKDPPEVEHNKTICVLLIFSTFIYLTVIQIIMQRNITPHKLSHTSASKFLTCDSGFFWSHDTHWHGKPNFSS